MRTSGLLHGNSTLLFAVEARRQLAAGSPRRAIETCKLGLARYPDHSVGYLVLAAAYRAVGEEDRARLVLMRGFERTGLAKLREMAEESTVADEAPAADAPIEPEAAHISEPPIESIADDEDLVTDVATEPLTEPRTETPEAIEAVEAIAPSVDIAVSEPEPEPTAEEPSRAVTDERLGDATHDDDPRAGIGRESARVEDSIAPAAEPVTGAATQSESPAVPFEELVDDEDVHSPLELVEERSAPAERIPWFQPRAPRGGEPARPSTLALHSGKSAHRLRSANLRLIPGLEYAPLRAEEQTRRLMIAPIMDEPLPDWEPRRRTSVVDDVPPLPEYPSVGSDQVPGSMQIDPSMRDATTRDVAHVETEPDAAEVSAIDELARRLEGARISPVGEAPPAQRHVFEPSIVSDTLADILVKQGAYGEAMKAFMTLARMRPAKLRYYEERIAEMKQRMVEEREEE
jgi:hypothetical protein